MMERDALISPDGRYRYWLRRKWNWLARYRPDHEPQQSGFLLWIMLNPSTADARDDDATIRKCVGFAQRWGFRHIEVVNLFAFRATYPVELAKAEDPVGPDNDAWIASLVKQARMLVGGWGDSGRLVHKRFQERIERLQVLTVKREVHCLGETLLRNPKHPSRPGYKTPREVYWT